jgi:hypothetical protein
MEKRIASLTTNPLTVNLMGRQCSLFIDPTSASIFVDEGEGDDRINGVVITFRNGPSFRVDSPSGANERLLLDYCGSCYLIGVSLAGLDLKQWVASANELIGQSPKSLGRQQLPLNGLAGARSAAV